jgi:subtilisin-like proprotein convertase family protein
MPAFSLLRHLPRLAVLIAAILILNFTFTTQPARAADAIFSNTNPITTTFENEAASPYPSMISVSQMYGTIVKVEVTLYDLNRESSGLLDVLLVSPGGQKVILMSNVCGYEQFADYDYTFADDADSEMDSNFCLSGRYKPTDFTAPYGGFYNLVSPAPAAPYSYTLSAFNSYSPNGTWSLYVAKNYGNTVSIDGGWSMTITTQINIPDSGTTGAASPYPWSQSISGRTGIISNVTVYLFGLSHTNPDDLDILLVSPHGEKVLLMSDACGTGLMQQGIFTFVPSSHSSATVLPDNYATTPCQVGGFFYLASNYGSGDTFPAPAPAGPYATDLNAFNGFSPNGIWSLYLYDDSPGSVGSLLSWELAISTIVGTPTPTHTPTTTPPAPDVNLVTNGTFANGLNGWTFYDSTRNVTNGELVIAPTAPGGGFYQSINYGSGGEIFEVNFRARNTSLTQKTLNIIVRDSDFVPSYNCVFGMTANTPFQYYRMRFDTSEGFIPMILQAAITGDSTLGLVIDDITMVRKTGISVPATECTVSPPANTELVFNGAFDARTGSWAAFNATMNSVNIGGTNGNIMQIGRNTGTTYGGFYQYSPFSAPANAVFQFSFQIGNQSAQARVINMLVRSEDWTDMHSCFITVPANTPLTNMTILLKTTKAWSNIVMQGWIQVGDYVSGPPPFRFDNISLQYLPASGYSGSTQCPAPLPMPQRVTNTPRLTPSLTPSLITTYTATATATPTAISTETTLPSATATASETPGPTDTATDVPTIEPPTVIPSETPSPPTPLPEGEGSATPEPPLTTPEPPPEVTPGQ